MRVLLVARHFNALNGGIGKYAQNVKDGLERAGVEVASLSSSRDSFLNYMWWAYVKLPFLLWRSKADVFHACSPVEAIFLPKSRSVVTYHDFMPSLNYSYTPLNILKKVGFWIGAKQAAKCRRIICVSDKTKKELLDYCNVDAAKITVIPNMIGDELSFTPYSPKKKFRIGYIAKYDDERKRVVEFVRLFRKIENPDIEFHFAGTGALLGRLKEAAEGDGRIKLYGRISDEEKQGFFAGLDLLLLPSRDEGFGIPIVEALKVGRPAAIFDDCTLPESLRDLCYVIPFSEEGVLSAVERARKDLSKGFDEEFSRRAGPYSIASVIGGILAEYEKV